MSHFEKRVQLNKIIESQLPEFLVADFPKAIEFFRQYYISQEHQGGNIDLVDNLDRYIKIDNLVPEVIVGKTTLTSAVTTTDTTINVASTKGFPDDYGLIKIGDEVITYTAKTTTSFTGCVRGFSGITGYDVGITSVFSNVNKQNIVFSDSKAAAHSNSATVENLSVLFLQEFYTKLKATFTPGLEKYDFVSDLDVGNFIKHARSFYQSKGIAESIRILFKVLYGAEAEVIDLETRLIKPSSAEYIRRETIVVENLEYFNEFENDNVFGDPFALEGQTIFRSNDLNTNASVSEVEIFTRENKAFYKMGLFVGYNDRDLVEGIFDVPGFTRILEPVSIGASIITVDSTIGFGATGILKSKGGTFEYSSKSINQFYGVKQIAGISTELSITDGIREDEVAFGFENGDPTKRVELRITGVLSELQTLEDVPLMEEDEVITVKNVGEVIYNPDGDKTYKEVFANSWIYNTKSRYEVKEINGSTFTLFTDVDKASLREGDSVDLMIGGSNNVAITTDSNNNTIVHQNAVVQSINASTNEVTLANLAGFVEAPNTDYSIRRNLRKVNTAGVGIDLGVNKYVANTLNVYTDDAEQFGYAASLSLPGYSIENDIVVSSLDVNRATTAFDPIDQTINVVGLGSYSEYHKSYSSIKFPDNTRLISGDRVIYTATNPLSGLESGESYYVKVIGPKEVRLYISKSQLRGDEYKRFDANEVAGSHEFVLDRHEDKLLSSREILRKFPLGQVLTNKKPDKRNIGNVGMLIDGVEITSPDSRDSIYYGPLDSFEVLNGGRDYNVQFPPSISIVSGVGNTAYVSGVSKQAYVEPVIEGSVKEVLVDPQVFDIVDCKSVTLTGGNGSGCVLEPIVGNRFREIQFDSRPLNLGGGVDINQETITFLEPHFLNSGDTIIYNQNGNEPIGIGIYGDPTNSISNYFVSGDRYVVGFINSTSIQLYRTEADAPLTDKDGNITRPGINTIGLSTATDASGIHKFRTLSRGNLRQVKVIDGGSGYSNRKLRVTQSGISTEYNTFSFKNHGFKTGEIVDYSVTTLAGLTTTNDLSVFGLDTNKQYSIDKVDDHSFRVIDVGIGNTVKDNLLRNHHVDITGIGTDTLNPNSGYHCFQYPPIKIVANVSYASTAEGEFIFTPFVAGPIVDSYLYEPGTGYGTTTLNLHKRPLINTKEGKNAQLAPVIVNGKITDVQVLNKGQDYVSPPALIAEDLGSDGTGAILRPVIIDGKLDDVVVINPGIGYSASSTNIFIKQREFGAKFQANVRNLEVNDAERFAEYSRSRSGKKIFSSLTKDDKKDKLVYGIYGYSQDLASTYDDNGQEHSPIIGWAYDGNPIYGPYGFDSTSNVGTPRLMKSSYELKPSTIEDRPNFVDGFFVEDFEYTGVGDLDKHNGRFCKTPDFPDGVYAYFAGVTTSQTTPNFEPAYPYFIGEHYKGNLITENLVLDHSFDFNNANISRNTFPYNVNQKYADYDFLNEGYEFFRQESEVLAVTQGEVNQVKINDGGVGYKIGDRVEFDLEGSGGAGLRAEVSEIVGTEVSSIDTTLDLYEDVVMVWDNGSQVSAYNRSGFDLNLNDVVTVGGLSTSITSLEGSVKIGFTTESVALAGTMTQYNAQSNGFVEDIFLSTKLNTVSIGNSIRVNGEHMTVLNNFRNGVLKVKRHGSSGVAHTLGSRIDLLNDRVTLPVRTQKFSSERQDIVYLNTSEAVGLGTTAGGAVQRTYNVGVTSYTVSIPTQTIHIPNHPFKNGQKVRFSKPAGQGLNSLIISFDQTTAGNILIPDVNTNFSDLYVIDKGRDFIGFATQVGLTTSGNGVYFSTGVTNSHEYKIESLKEQITGDVSRIKTLVSCGSTHGLVRGDTVKLSVQPNTVVGVGTTAALTLAFNEIDKKILVNPTGIASAGINTFTNTITLANHGYETGDKLYYTSVQPFGGLTDSENYYAIRDGKDEFRLAETLYDTNPLTEKEVNIVGTGDTTHTFALINPQINVVRNSDIQFNLQSPTLNGYELKIYREPEFLNEYVSSFDSRDFNVQSVGTIGLGTASNASLTVNYSKNVPSKLYYALEKGGYISTADKEVTSFSEINYVDSAYNGTYQIFDETPTQFFVSPSKLPSVFNYTSDQCDKLEYRTKSSSGVGAIGNVEVLSKGFSFDKLPKFREVVDAVTDKSQGRNANLVAISTSIGRIKKTRFKDIGYDYSSDKTLRPEASIPPVVEIDNLDTVTSVDIQFGGENYLAPPKLILWNDESKKIIDRETFIASAPNGSISEVEQIAPIRGLDSQPHRLIPIDNQNGVGIVSMTTSHFGIATCVLTTPILGFNQVLFEQGDYVYVENIEHSIPSNGPHLSAIGIGTTTNKSEDSYVGSGWNSADYDFKFFRVKEFNNTSPAILTFELVGEDGVGLTTNPGIAKTYQSGYGTIVNKKNFPILNIVQERSKFEINEELYVDSNKTGLWQETDLRISLVRDDYIKVKGTYNLVPSATNNSGIVTTRIRGKVSGSIAEVVSVDRKRSKIVIDYASKQDIGWRDDVGKISQDYQVIPNNDYYQNLSYSIKSPITWQEFSSPVNSIVHPAGMKNFADVGISSAAQVGAGDTISTIGIVILDVVGEKRVDVINNFDFGLDNDPRPSGVSTFLQSNSLQLENRKLTDYTECRTNRVLIHDDISDKFSSRGFQDVFSELEEVQAQDNHIRYTIQIVDPDTSDMQVSEVILQSNDTNTFLFEKYSTFTNEKLGDFRADIDSVGRKTLIFEPTDPYERDHDIKLLRKTYLYQDLPASETGIGTQTVGQVDLTGSFVSGINSIGVAPGISTSIKTLASFDSANFNGAFASVEITDRFETEPDHYIEAYIDFDGTNTFLSEYYFDTTTQAYSATQTGILTVAYDSNAGIVSLRARNVAITSEGPVYDVRSNIIGFGATTAGIGTYRFLLNNQPPGDERSARIESTVGFGTTAVSLGTFDIDTISSSNSIVRVAAGSTSSLHQVVIMANDKDLSVTVTPGPYSVTNNSVGIGTFGGVVNGREFTLNFYPDAGYTVEAQAMNEVFYRVSDFDNQALDLNYGPINKRLLLTAFDGLNGLRANRTAFEITHNNFPIYNKSFDPADTTKLDYETGLFTFPNHFFNTGEELTYIPKSTFISVGQTAMGIGATESYAGIVTTKLPDIVFPIALTPDTFKLATKEEYARAGIFVTFTDAGLGNAHELEFTKKLTKTVIGLDGIVQQPITFTPVKHDLENNGGGINAGISTFNLSGISSVQPRDILKIDDEYMKVIEVGFSTNANGQILGPINGIIAAGAAATHPTVSVQRGIVGTAATDHTDGSNVQIHRGSINIVKNTLHFVDPPKGNTRARRDEGNLPYVRAQFSGRTFLRSNYSTNMLFDDISDQFTGIGKTYTNTILGVNTTGIDEGNGILFINGVFQTPTTENNAGNNYFFENDANAGISSVVFTGITSTDGSFIQSEFDINQNQIPRGGLVVSLGSTPGLGYAPLVGAKAIAKKNSSGTLTEIVGINTYVNPVAVSTAQYDRFSGILEVTTQGRHSLRSGDRVFLAGLGFTCDLAPSTPKTYPDKDRSYDIFNIVDAETLNVRIGPSTLEHHYVSGGEIFEHFSLNIGSGYRGPVSIGVTDIAYEHRFVSSGIGSITASSGGPFTATGADYTSFSGKLVITIPNHGLTTSDTIQIIDNGLVFKCSDDGFFTDQSYPRSTDPASGQNLAIASVSTNTITVNVGPGGGAGYGANVTATVGAGGTLGFNLVNGGTGYVNPKLIIPEPNYENMPVVGVSRLGTGSTTETGKNLLLNLTIAQTTEKETGDRFFDAANLIEDNAAFIADIAYGRMLAQFPSYTPPAGTSGRDCKDDIVDVLESIAYNTKFGGNDLTVDAANLYITGAHVAGEEAETIYAFEQARDMAIQAMRNESITVGGYSTLTQVFDRTITDDIVEYTPTNATYTASNGNFVVTIANHGFQIGDQVRFKDNSFTFTCSKDGNLTNHTYPRSTDPASGNFLTIDNVTTNTFRVNVGASPSGQQYTHTFVSAITNAVEYRLSSTTTPAQCANVASAIHTLAGIVTFAVGQSTIPTRTPAPGAQFNVSDFKIARNGYGFKPGDVVKVVGLVTAKDYTQPIEDFKVEITQTFNDFYSAWSFGQMDYIDNVKGYQDGNRKRFPLFYNGELLSFEIDLTNNLSSAINLDSVLLIFINGVLQTPGYAYQFTGGTSVIFTEAPRVNDDVDIFFYVGQKGVDVGITTVTETLKVGDDVFVRANPSVPGTASQLTKRTIAEITGSDILETSVYTGPGISQDIFKPFEWAKQKRDKFIKGDVVYKTRDSIEPKIFPTAKVIGDITPESTEIFVDNAQFFDYDEVIYDLNVNSFDFDAFVMPHGEVTGAGFTAVVGSGGTISAVQIANPGAGYTGNQIDLKFSAPLKVGVGIGTTATATASIQNGQVSSVSITNPGFGYTDFVTISTGNIGINSGAVGINSNFTTTGITTRAVVPSVIAPVPAVQYENIKEVSNVQGFSGIITGIKETIGSTGHKAIQFFFNALTDYGINGEAQNASDTNGLQPGYPVMIYGTGVGHGVVSVYDSNDSVVGVGTTFLDNIYIVDSRTTGFQVAANGEIICNVHGASNLTGIGSTGGFNDTQIGFTTSLGTISWGRIYNFDERANPISIGVTGLTVDAGLSTFPTIQRRGNFGQGKTGAVRAIKPQSDPSRVVDSDLPFYS